MLILGVDEAGRGAVLGPMVLGAVLIRAENLSLLQKIGVKDSKCLSPQKREELYNQLEQTREVSLGVCFFTPEEIDRESLQVLFQKGLFHLVCRYRPELVQLDLPVPSCRVSEYVEKLKALLKVVVEGQNQGEGKYPAVAAASIVAKVVRDRAMRALEKEWGEELGSGYPSDPRTRAFLRRVALKGSPPVFVRRKWKTFQKLLQGRLFEKED